MSQRWIALLRGINVGKANRVPMAELRSALTDDGWRDVATYIQSGNVLFSADGTAGQLAAALHRIVEQNFGIDVPAIVLPADRLAAAARSNPFADLELEPKFVHVFFAQHVVDDLTNFDHDRFSPDRLAVAEGTIYAAYPNGVARSKLTTAVVDAAIGFPTTARNWNTVQKLQSLAEQA